jgi:hypothetical protein
MKGDGTYEERTIADVKREKEEYFASKNIAKYQQNVWHEKKYMNQ